MSNTRECPACKRKVSFFAMTRVGICEDCLNRLGADWQNAAALEQAEIENRVEALIASGQPVDWSDVPKEIMLRHAEAILLSTSFEIPGRRVLEVVKIVGAESAMGMNIFRDGSNAWRDVIGGRSDTVQAALRTNRENCLRELQFEALRCGASAVIAVDLDYSEFSSQVVSGGMLFTAATGTAVKLAPPLH